MLFLQLPCLRAPLHQLINHKQTRFSLPGASPPPCWQTKHAGTWDRSVLTDRTWLCRALLRAGRRARMVPTNTTCAKVSASRQLPVHGTARSNSPEQLNFMSIAISVFIFHPSDFCDHSVLFLWSEILPKFLITPALMIAVSSSPQDTN